MDQSSLMTQYSTVYWAFIYYYVFYPLFYVNEHFPFETEYPPWGHDTVAFVPHDGDVVSAFAA